MIGRRLAAAGGAGALAAGAALLWDLGQHVLSAPPTTSWADAAAWYHDVGPAVACISVLRVLTAAGCAWLCLATILQLLASLPAGSVLRRAADVISPQSLRRLGQGMAGLSLTAGLTLPAAGVDTPPVAMDPPDALATMLPLDEVDQPAPPVPAAPAVAEPAPAEPAPAATVAADEHTVEPGESFWRIAEDVVGEALGRTPDEDEVRGYWVRLMDANADRLVVAGVADLLFAGQLLVLPAP